MTSPRAWRTSSTTWPAASASGCPMVRDFWVPFSAKVTEGREKIAKQIEVTDIPCPLTGDKGDMLVKRFGRNGWFLGCAGYPECKYTQPLPGEEPEEIPEMPGVGEVCPLCNEGHLAAKRGRFGPFVGCDRYPECRYIKKNPPPASEQFGTCPQCGQGTVVTKRARRGRRPFWGCDRYPDCDYASWTRPETPAASAAAPATGPRRSGRGRPGARQRRRSAWLTAAPRLTPPARWSASFRTSRPVTPHPARSSNTGVMSPSSSASSAIAAPTGGIPTAPRCVPTWPRWPTASWRPRRSAAAWRPSAPSTATPPARAGSRPTRWPASAPRGDPAGCRAC